MTDKLKWLNQHIVLFQHNTVDDVVKNENYRIPFELRDQAAAYPDANEFARSLFDQKKFKECGHFLSYNLHKRALAWWAYCCVLNLREELKQSPEKPVDISDIGKPKELEIPDFAKIPDLDKFPDGTRIPKSIEDLQSIPAYAQMMKKADALKAQGMEGLKKVPPQMLEHYHKVRNEMLEAFKAQTGGKTPQDMYNDALNNLKTMLKERPFDKAITDPLGPYKESPIYKASEKLKADLEKMRLDIIDKIKAAVPVKCDAEKLEQTSRAIDAAYALIAAPDDKTAKDCMDFGNECPDLPEGLLALVCFWCYGNLAPNPDDKKAPVIKTPAGLAANGMNSLITMCALAKGGINTYKQRIEEYCTIGLQVAIGVNNWAESLEKNKEPHNDSSPERFIGSPFEHAYDYQEENAPETNVQVEEISAEDAAAKHGFVRFKG